MRGPVSPWCWSGVGGFGGGEPDIKCANKSGSVPLFMDFNAVMYSACAK